MATPLCGATACACAITGGLGDDELIDVTVDGTGTAGDQFEITATIDHDTFNSTSQIGAGLTGFLLPENVGSADAPTLRANTAGTWGAGDLSFTGSSINGASVYADVNGQLRTVPEHYSNIADSIAAWPATITPTQTGGTATASATQATITISNPSSLRASRLIGAAFTRVSNVTAATGTGVQFTLTAVAGAFSTSRSGAHVNATPAGNFADADTSPFSQVLAAAASASIAISTSVTWRTGTWTSLVLTGNVGYTVLVVTT